MEINGNNVFKSGSILPVAFVVEGLSPDVDLTEPETNMTVTFYAVDECKGIIKNAKKITLVFANDDDKFVQTDEYNTFVCLVDTKDIDEGRLAGEVSFEFKDELSSLPVKPKVPFITDYIIEKW